MSPDLQPLLDLVPADGEIAFDAWKQSVVQSTGRPVSNRQFNALRKQAIALHKHPETGVLMVARKPEASS